MKKLWKRVTGKSPSRNGEASPKSGSTRGSVASLNIGYEVREKDLGKLHKAAWKGDLHKVKQLARKDPSILDKENRTPLHLACVQGHEDIVQELLEWKAKANIGDNQCKTPLMRAIEFQQEGCVNLLLSYNVEINTADVQGNTPLHLAAEADNLNIIIVLIRKGANLNARNKEGLVPFHLAVKQQNEEVCRLFLQEKAEVNVEDTNMRTPLMYASQEGSLTLVKLLLQYNADVNRKDSNGWAAYDYALMKGHRTCSDLIQEHQSKTNMTRRSTSNPPSLLSTPRDKNSIGLPALDGGADEESENESVSKASGAPGSDSWADSPDVSVADQGGKKLKIAAPKINLTKFAQNIHISESDTDGESVRGASPGKAPISGPGGDGNDHSLGMVAGVTTSGVGNKVIRQTSLQSQTSGEDNSWGDSPLSPRRVSNLKVSFQTREAMRDTINKPGVQLSGITSAVTEALSGYVPSAPVKTFAQQSPEKFKVPAQKPALMEELGISDVDDITEESEDANTAPPLPPFMPPPPSKEALPADQDDSKGDSSIVSGILETPRHGILKNASPIRKVADVKTDHPQAQAYENSPARGSDDEESSLDVTDKEHDSPVQAVSQPRTEGPPKRESTSEWDSELEDMVNPLAQLGSSKTINQIAVPSLFTSQINKSDHEDEWDSTTEASTPRTPRMNAGLYYSQNNLVWQPDVTSQNSDIRTAQVVLPPPQGVLPPPQVVLPPPQGVLPSPLPASPNPVGNGAVSKPTLAGLLEEQASADEEGGNSDSWDSEADELPSDNAQLFIPALGQVFGAQTLNEHEGSSAVGGDPIDETGKLVPESEDENESDESMSSWEKERQQSKLNQTIQPSPSASTTTASQVFQKMEVEQVSKEAPRPLQALNMSEHNEPLRNDRHLNTRAEKLRESADMFLLDKEETIIAFQGTEWSQDGTLRHGQQQNLVGQFSERPSELNTEWRLQEGHMLDLDDSHLISDSGNTSFSMDSVLYQQQELTRIDERFQKERHEREKREEEERERLKQEEETKQIREEEEARKIRQVEETTRIREEEEARKVIEEQESRRNLEQEERRIREQEERRIREEQEARRMKEEQEAKRIKEEQGIIRIREEEKAKRLREEHEEKRIQAEQEARRLREDQEMSRVREEQVYKTESLSTLLKSSPPKVPPKPPLPVKTQPVLSSSVTSSHIAGGNSAIQELRQRLQVIPSSPLPSGPSGGLLYPWGDDFLDDESEQSDNPGDERMDVSKFYSSGLSGAHNLRPYDPLDDDALSYTSTEFEDPVQSTVSYAKERDILANLNITDSSTLLQVQELVRETRRNMERERNYRIVLENKLKIFYKERAGIIAKMESLEMNKSTLEQNKLDLDAKIRSLEYSVSEEKEKRMNAEVLLAKTKEQLDRKESQFSNELEAQHQSDLSLRNLEMQLRATVSSIKELEEDKQELQRQLAVANSARILQEQINEDQQKLLFKQQQRIPRDEDLLESTLDMRGDTNTLKAELYAVKMELDRQRSRFKDEISLMGAENEELMSKVDELKNDLKLKEEALVRSSTQYNIQLSTLKADLSTAHSVSERERAAKEKCEAEMESVKTRLANASLEVDKVSRTQSEIEREMHREKETWQREISRKENDAAGLKENIQLLNQRLSASENKINSLENELHLASSSVAEKTSAVLHLQQELEQQKMSWSSLEQNYRLEKEQNSKLQDKLENSQEKLTQQQHENLSLRQQVETLRLNVGNQSGADAQDKLDRVLANLRAEGDRVRASLEERNSSLLQQVVGLKEEVRVSEATRATLQQDERRLHQEHSDMVRKLAQAEASLQIALKTKEHLEQERATLRIEHEKLQQRYQLTHDKSVEASARVSELVDRLEKAENNSMLSHRQLIDTSANIQELVKSKFEQDDSFQQLQIEYARLEAEFRSEKQRAEMLLQDLQDSQKVRSSLEALCSNLKSSSAHLEEKLGAEYAARVMYEAEAKDHKTLYDQEIQSRSKLGLRIADLERHRQSSESKIIEEKHRANSANEERRAIEARLEAEMSKSQQLQKDVTTLKMHLKSAKHKIKDERNGSAQCNIQNGDSFNRGEISREIHALNHNQQIRQPESYDDIRAELEAKYRQELARKLEEVNKFLESQSYHRSRLDNSRTEVETNIASDRRRMEEEMHNLRVKFEQAITQRETKEMEAKHFRDLYESEIKRRYKMSDHLHMSTEASASLQSKLNNERLHRNRLVSSIGNLGSPIINSTSFDLGKINNLHEDELSNKIKAELDRSIAKHLEAAPHDYKKPVKPSAQVPTLLTSSLTQSSQDYIDVLKRKFYV